MRVGVIVDGDSERDSLPELRNSLEPATGNLFLPPVVVPMTPLAPLGTLAAACVQKMRALAARDVDFFLILIDRETREECPGELASQLIAEIRSRFDLDSPVFVVVKNSTFENWLIADPQALIAQSAHFDLSVCQTIARQVTPNRADQIDAMEILRRATRRDSYNKRADSRRILQRADIETMARNSRSFRRFLRCVGHPTYNEQSRHPAPVQG